MSKKTRARPPRRSVVPTVKTLAGAAVATGVLKGKDAARTEAALSILDELATLIRNRGNRTKRHGR